MDGLGLGRVTRPLKGATLKAPGQSFGISSAALTFPVLSRRPCRYGTAPLRGIVTARRWRGFASHRVRTLTLSEMVESAKIDTKSRNLFVLS